MEPRVRLEGYSPQTVFKSGTARSAGERLTYMLTLNGKPLTASHSLLKLRGQYPRFSETTTGSLKQFSDYIYRMNLKFAYLWALAHWPVQMHESIYSLLSYPL